MGYKLMVATLLEGADLFNTRLTDVCKTLDVSVTTLQTSLAQEGCSYLELREMERATRAAVALADNPRMSAESLAEICGYTESNTFCRAFPRWFGVGLREYKYQSRMGVSCT